MVDSSPRPLALSEEEREIALYGGHQGGVYDDVEQEAFKPWEYLAVVRRHKLAIILFTLIALGATAISTSLQTPIYRSSVKLQIDREVSRVAGFEGAASQVYYIGLDFYQTQYELLKSRALATKVVENLGLKYSAQFQAKEETSFFKEIMGFWLGRENGDETSDKVEASTRTLENLLLSNVVVSPIKGSRLVLVHYDSPNPELSAKVVNALARSYIDMNMERRFENSSYAKTFLSDRITQVRSDLEESERKLIEYAAERKIVDVDTKRSSLIQKLQTINSRMTEVEQSRIKAESIFQEMNVGGVVGVGQVAESELIHTYKEKLVDLQTRYEQDLLIYKPEYPGMQRIKGQIDEIQKKIVEETAAIQATIRANYQANAREQALLQARMADIKGQILEMQRRSTDYQALKRDVATNLELYDGLLQRIKEEGVSAGMEINNISIVDKGQVPGSAYKPNLRKNLKIALMVGLLGGVGLAFLFEYLDDTIKSATDLEKLTGLPVLGIVPEWPLEDENDSVAMTTYNEPRSAIAEAYRSCRTALSFSSATGTPDILHIASSISGEGKTTTAISLALTYVQAGSNVLLVDCDLRNPSLHNELDVSNETGLTNYLAGGYKPNQVVQRGDIAGLYILTSGPLPPNPVELLGSGKMMELLQTAADKFDVVIIDGPPVLGLADALILANMCSVTIMVVDAGVTRTGTLTGALQRLKRAGTNVLGAVLAKYGQGRSGYGYDYDYRYQYNYYSYSSDDANDQPKLAS